MRTQSPAQYLADQLTLFKPRGADYACHTTASPPNTKCYLHISHYSMQGRQIMPVILLPAPPLTQNDSDLKMLILGYDMANV